MANLENYSNKLLNLTLTNLAFKAAEQKRVNLEMQLVPGRVLHTEEKTKIKSDCKYSGKFKEIYIQQYKG